MYKLVGLLVVGFMVGGCGVDGLALDGDGQGVQEAASACRDNRPITLGVELTWIGNACFKLTTPGGKVLVLDPFILGDPVTPPEWKDLSRFSDVDAVLVSHGHPDHFADAVAIAKLANVPLYGNNGLRNQISPAGLNLLPNTQLPYFGVGGPPTPLFGTDLKIVGVHADHTSEITYVDPATGKSGVYAGGAPMGIIIELENGYRIYFMGDTALFSDIQLIAKMYRPNLLMIPIGGVMIMGPKEAATATQWVKPDFAIPMHFGTFPFLPGTPEQYIDALGSTKTTVVTMEPGETISL